MKYIIVLLLFSAFGCKKDNCIMMTDSTGQSCCEKCFRTKQQQQDFLIDNAGKDCSEICN